MLLILLFLLLFAPRQSLPVADLNFIMVKQVYSSFVKDNQIFVKNAGLWAEHGDMALISLKYVQPYTHLLVDTQLFSVFTSNGQAHLVNNQIVLNKPANFLLFLVKDSLMVDVYTQKGKNRLALVRHRKQTQPIVFENKSGQRITTLVIRQPSRHVSILAQEQKTFAHIGHFYFLINRKTNLQLQIFSLSQHLALGKTIVFYPHGTEAKNLNSYVRLLENELIINSDTFWTSVPDTALVNYAQLDTTARLMMKYATKDNFTHTQLYPCAKCLLRYSAAKDLLRASEQFRDSGYRIVLFDCYRPLSIQRKMWQSVHNINYVAPPSKKSSHNRGAAVDITLCTPSGRLLDMGTPIDFFGPQAGNDYAGLTYEQKANRRLLQSVLQEHNFLPIRTEWWHFYHAPSVRLAALDIPLPCPRKE